MNRLILRQNAAPDKLIAGDGVLKRVGRALNFPQSPGQSARQGGRAAAFVA